MVPALTDLRGLYAQTLILVDLVGDKLFSCLDIISPCGGVTTGNFDRIIPLFVLYLPTPTRTRHECVRPKLFSPEFVKKKQKTTSIIVLAY